MTDEEPPVVAPESPRRDTYRVFDKVSSRTRALRVARWVLLALAIAAAAYGIGYWFKS